MEHNTRQPLPEKFYVSYHLLKIVKTLNKSVAPAISFYQITPAVIGMVSKEECNLIDQQVKECRMSTRKNDKEKWKPSKRSTKCDIQYTLGIRNSDVKRRCLTTKDGSRFLDYVVAYLLVETLHRGQPFFKKATDRTDGHVFYYYGFNDPNSDSDYRFRFVYKGIPYVIISYGKRANSKTRRHRRKLSGRVVKPEVTQTTVKAAERAPLTSYAKLTAAASSSSSISVAIERNGNGGPDFP